MSDWQEIICAPMDGSHILLYRPEIQFVGFYATRVEYWCVVAPGVPKMNPQPTHWRHKYPDPKSIPIHWFYERMEESEDKIYLLLTI